MTPTVSSVAILVAAAAGLLALRFLSRRIRIAFDVVCFVALSVVLHQLGAAPLLASSAAAPDMATLWLRVLDLEGEEIAFRSAGIETLINFAVVKDKDRLPPDRWLRDDAKIAAAIASALGPEGAFLRTDGSPPSP